MYGLVSDNLEAEFQGLICTMQHAWSKGYQDVLFEGDCRELVDMVTGAKRSFGLYNWVREIGVWSSKFQHCSFV